MAVYTTLEWDDVATIVERFGIGELCAFEGISAGMENSNYFVTSSSNHQAYERGPSQGEYVLTVFEELPEAHLPFHIQLLDVLHRAAVPVAAPIRDVDSAAIQHVKDKPAVLCPRLQGAHPEVVTVAQCAAIGQALAKVHNALQDMPNAETHVGIRNHTWLKHSIAKAAAYMNEDDRAIAAEVMTEYEPWINAEGLSKSCIHGDLFRDNSMFNGDNLTGIIDFFNAGYGHCVYDLAIVANDWCVTETGELDKARLTSLLQAYQQIRPFSEQERQSWPVFLQVTALRFWVSRLLSTHAHVDSHHELGSFKDPNEFKAILLAHRDSNPPRA